MEQDEITVPQDETQIEETPAEEAVVEPEETPETKLATAQAEAAKYRRLFEKEQAKPKGNPQAAPVNVEETVLLAQGMPENLMKELKVVAQVRGLNLLKAQNDPIFVAVKEKYEEDQKRETAQLPAARGASPVKAKKDLSTPGLSREEHMAMTKSTF